MPADFCRAIGNMVQERRAGQYYQLLVSIREETYEESLLTILGS